MNEPNPESQLFDVAIVGGSFAGLAAALQLGRGRRQVAVIDAGLPRNRFAEHSHGFLTQDGRPPLEILKTAREQVERYPTVKFMAGRAVAVESLHGRFRLELGDGQTAAARRLILAYGVKDELPAVPGMQERWGKTVFHCPYCHGYEFRDLPLGVYGAGAAAVHQSIMLKDWSDRVTLFLRDGESLASEERDRILRRGVTIEETAVARLTGSGVGLEKVELADGRTVEINGLLMAPTFSPASSLHSSLGCETTQAPNGTYITVDERRATTVPGVFAAGDLTRAMHSVTFAASDGVMAGSASHHSLLAEDW